MLSRERRSLQWVLEFSETGCGEQVFGVSVSGCLACRCLATKNKYWSPN